MPSWFHAKTSRFFLRNWTSLVLISGLSVVLILVVFAVSPSTNSTISRISTLSSSFSSIIHIWFSFVANTV